jgi:acetyltransferase-like isoleucine patch superfamily enzyme
MNVLVLARRFLVPAICVTAYGLWKWRAFVSWRAEVELSPKLRMGKGTIISSFTKFKASDGEVVLGAKCGFGSGCFVTAGVGGLILGDNVIVGPNVSIIADNYGYEKLDVPLEQQTSTSKGIRIGNNVWIGANCVILDGTHIGDNSIVVAGSMVNRRFPPGCIIQGNPAKILLRRTRSIEPKQLEVDVV